MSSDRRISEVLANCETQYEKYSDEWNEIRLAAVSARSLEAAIEDLRKVLEETQQLCNDGKWGTAVGRLQGAAISVAVRGLPQREEVPA